MLMTFLISDLNGWTGGKQNSEIEVSKRARRYFIQAKTPEDAITKASVLPYYSEKETDLEAIQIAL